MRRLESELAQHSARAAQLTDRAEGYVGKLVEGAQRCEALEAALAGEARAARAAERGAQEARQLQAQVRRPDIREWGPRGPAAPGPGAPPRYKRGGPRAPRTRCRLLK